MKKIAVVLISVLCVSLNGCSGANNSSGATPSPTSAPMPNDLAFPSSDLWGEGVENTVWDDDFRVAMTKIIRRDDNTFCYIKTSSELGAFTTFQYASHTQVQCQTPTGDIVFQRDRENLDIIKDIIFTADGSLNIVELKTVDPTDTTPTFHIRILALDNDWQIAQDVVLNDTPDERDLYYYALSEDNGTERTILDSLSDGERPLLFDNAVVQFERENDTLYLLAYAYGVTLYQLGSDLQPMWSYQAMPAYTWLYIDMLQPNAALTIDTDGTAYIGFELFGDDIEFYHDHFQRQLVGQNEQSKDAADIGVVKIDYAGNLLTDFRIGIQDITEKLVDLFIAQDSLVAFSNVRHTKSDIETGSTEWDIAMLVSDKEQGAFQTHRFIHHDREDLASSVVQNTNGDYLIAGQTGFDQVDTNSVVSNPEGMLLMLNGDGDILKTRVLKAPRAVYIHYATFLENGQALFAGKYDSYITHTCDNDASQCFEKAMLGLTSLIEVGD